MRSEILIGFIMKQHNHPNRWYLSTKLASVTTQVTIRFIFIATQIHKTHTHHHSNLKSHMWEGCLRTACSDYLALRKSNEKLGCKTSSCIFQIFMAVNMKITVFWMKHIICYVKASTFWRNLPFPASERKANQEDGVAPKSNKKPSKKSVQVL